MKIIDADKVRGYIYSRWGCDPAYYNDPEAEEAFRILEFMEKCPTIEAISIGFIKSYGFDLCERDQLILKDLISSWEEEND